MKYNLAVYLSNFFILQIELLYSIEPPPPPPQNNNQKKKIHPYV